MSKSTAMEMLPYISRLWRLSIITDAEKNKLSNQLRNAMRNPALLTAFQEELETIKCHVEQRDAYEIDCCIRALYRN